MPSTCLSSGRSPSTQDSIYKSSNGGGHKSFSASKDRPSASLSNIKLATKMALLIWRAEARRSFTHSSPLYIPKLRKSLGEERKLRS